MRFRAASAEYLDLKAQIRNALGAAGMPRASGISMETAVAEPGDSLQSTLPDERLVQAIWNEQLFRRDALRTLTGLPVQVIDPGRWSGSGPGPDFRTAELEIGGRRLRGDVEIHVESAEWDRHQHSRDFEYNGVILHVFLRRTDPALTDELHNGSRAERLELEPVLQPDLDTIVRSLGADEYQFTPVPGTLAGCREAVARLDPDLLRRFLLQAARERLEEKAARFAAQRAGESEDQVLYQAVMASMGHRGGKTLYFLLAKRTPIEELKDYLRDTPLPELHLALESVFLHVAGLATPSGHAAGSEAGEDLFSGLAGIHAGLPDKGRTEPCRSAALDSETLAYLDRLHRHWSELSGYFTDRIIPPTRRWYDGVRPPNFPGRRLAGVARLLAGFDFRRGLLESLARRVDEARQRQPRTARDFRREIAQLSLLFAAEGESYWSTRYTLGGRPAPRRMQLIGDDRAAAILYNALLPNVLLYARSRKNRALEEFIWRLHENFPALPDNSVTRFMTARLFGPSGPPAILDFRYEKFNQALLHIFSECCNDAARSCEDCVFASRAVSGG